MIMIRIRNLIDFKVSFVFDRVSIRILYKIMWKITIKIRGLIEF